MRKVNIIQVVLSAFINLIIVFVLASFIASLPFPPINKKFMLISNFFLYHLVFLIFNQSRDIGMMALDLDWREKYPKSKQILNLLINTACFATIFYSIFFTFDLFLVNLILLQLPSFLMTGTIFSSFLAGGMTIVVKPAGKSIQTTNF